MRLVRPSRRQLWFLSPLALREWFLSETRNSYQRLRSLRTRSPPSSAAHSSRGSLITGTQGSCSPFSTGCTLWSGNSLPILSTRGGLPMMRVLWLELTQLTCFSKWAAAFHHSRFLTCCNPRSLVMKLLRPTERRHTLHSIWFRCYALKCSQQGTWMRSREG